MHGEGDYSHNANNAAGVSLSDGVTFDHSCLGSFSEEIFICSTSNILANILEVESFVVLGDLGAFF